MPNPKRHTPPTPEQLAAARKHRGYSQSELAAVLLDLDPEIGRQLKSMTNRIQQWEQGTVEPSPVYVRTLRTVLDLDQESQP